MYLTVVVGIHTQTVMLSDPGVCQTSLSVLWHLESDSTPSILSTRKIHTNWSIAIVRQVGRNKVQKS